ncbi:hypothetical protein [Gloeobacter kilaueensis]|uniref:Uncharacterized protein n=1 Tax=Gloeobacter kilaueensis (strain ATCC BAA-2537 / CCAP 1431/1 / ULC 316 / JS1) TaxID=1183438 RepID=U5QQ64_GLOK1|nr:hypothetical protein [Gloeobacter kilaueensis]AGY59789.1 hypothetical protein GKIL_3543 [Gloeobacter kilaueensis JS1]
MGDITRLVATISNAEQNLPNADISLSVSCPANNVAQQLDAVQTESGGVGAPGLLESLIPVWGSGRQAIDDFQNGRVGWGLFNTALAISDVFLIKSLATAAIKGVVAVAAREAVGDSIRATGAFWSGARTGGEGFGKLAGLEVTITEKGLSIVKEHLMKFGDISYNTAMVSRLEEALANGLKISGSDASFYTHEISEATLMKSLLEQGIESSEAYFVAHEAALKKYNVSRFSVYHPDVIKQFPGEFSRPFWEFYGLER